MKIPTHYNDLFEDLYHYQGGDEDIIKARLRLGDTIVATVNNRVTRIKMIPNFKNLGLADYISNRCFKDTLITITSKPGFLTTLYSGIIIQSENQLIFK